MVIRRTKIKTEYRQTGGDGDRVNIMGMWCTGGATPKFLGGPICADCGPIKCNFRHKTISKSRISNNWQWRLRKLRGYEFLWLTDSGKNWSAGNLSQNQQRPLLLSIFAF